MIGPHDTHDFDPDFDSPDLDPGEIEAFDTFVAAQAGHHQLTVPTGSAGTRLDKLLADQIEGLSRSRIQQLLESGRVSSGGRTITQPSYRVKSGQGFDVSVPEPVSIAPEPEDIPLAIVHEDADLLVIDKAAGMVVHPAAGNPNGTLVNALMAHCGASLSGIGGVRRPGIVHRLDKDTSGLMVVAKTDRAHARLSAQFADRSLTRTYHAVVRGVPAPASGEIAANIGRSPTDRKKMAVLRAGGRPAITRYRVLRAYGHGIASLVECRLLTGRTHQIRVHLTSIGHPLIGDPVYGGRRPHGALGAAIKSLPEPVRTIVVGFPRQALHAVAIEFDHPTSGEKQRFTVDLPNDIAHLIATLEGI